MADLPDLHGFHVVVLDEIPPDVVYVIDPSASSTLADAIDEDLDSQTVLVCGPAGVNEAVRRAAKSVGRIVNS